jgi:putative RecB family exonuclease
MTMPYPVPTSLSPSRVEAFTSCPLAFRFSSIERLPEPPSPHAAKGTLVHRGLELLFGEEPAGRTPPAAHDALERAVVELRDDPELAMLELSPEDEQAFVADAHSLVDAYLALEDPTTVNAVGLELQLEAQVGGLQLRGIIDRLEQDADGAYIITDYKTGSAPSVRYEQGRLGGVHFYAFLCEQALGRRPAIIRLMYLRNGTVIEARPTDRSARFLPQRTEAVWRAIAKACETGEFKPRPSRLCGHCAFQAWCPAFGGDPDRAALEAPVRYGRGPVQLPFDAVPPERTEERPVVDPALSA